MNLLRVRSMLEEARHRHRRRQGGERSSSSDTSESINSTPSIPSQRSDTTARAALSEAELLQRARAAYASEDFAALAGGPVAHGPWVRVEAIDRFVVFQRPAASSNNLEVLCAGRLDASLEEVASILRSNSEGELNCAMSALYSKSFIFGSYEREISCTDKNQTQDDGDSDGSEHLAVKTKSFARTSVLGRNEQWCYFDYFRRKSERDGFTVTKRALPASEPIPGRITERSAHVEQLHGLSASYLVDKPPDQKGLRVVFRAWFQPPDNGLNQPQDTRSSSSRQSSSSSSSSGSKSTTDRGDTRKFKAQLRRLLSMARGITHLPKIVRRRRFGVQVPADLSAIRAQNTRCPCCTHSLAPLKLSLSIAASAIATRSLAHVKMATRRCYLCGYFVCANCWTAEHMESAAGRIAAIVVCTRCHANVQACEYSEVFATRNERHRGPPRVVEDSNNSLTASLLIDALNDSLLTAATGSAKHAATMNVIRTLLRQNIEDEAGDSQQTTPRFEPLDDSEAVTKLLTDAVPILGDCTLGNAEQRCYTIDLPDNPNTGVPRSPIPRNEAERISTLKASGLLRLANCLAPEVPHATLSKPKPDTYDLELICQLAAKTLDCAYSFVAVMCAKHEHFMAASQPGIAGAVIPREHTTCQHALMSPDPFVATHHEADVRLHRANTTVQFGIRFYVGFPLILRGVTVGMFCCIDSKPRAEITRSQYATMKRLANAATLVLHDVHQSRIPEIVEPNTQHAIMSLSRVRGVFDEVGRRRRQGWGGSGSMSSDSALSSTPSLSTLQSDEGAEQEVKLTPVRLSDAEMLERARAAHNREDFAALSAGPEANGPWKRVRSVDRFVVFRRDVVVSNNSSQNELDVLCAGRLDASIEEVASILRSSSEMEHNASMTALYAKSFIFGSYEREVYCSQQSNQSENSGERLTVKTKTFTRTSMLGRNEQWCYFDYFLRKTERDGFTISKRAVPPTESVPGRIVGENARVDQLHGLNASCLVDRPPSQKRLRVVLRAWFDDLPDQAKTRSSSQSAPGSSVDRLSSASSTKSSPGSLKSLEYRDAGKRKAQLRRLLAMANGVTNLPDLVRRRRFGVQVPASTGGSNARCPCCTHSLAPVKLSIVKAASAIKSRSLAPFRVDTRRCYLCGYLVCIDCWSTDQMESVSGRVASIVVCTRCNANVQACEYSEVFAGTAAEREKHRGPPRVVEDSNNDSTVSLLVDFLSASALNSTAGSPEHAAVVAVIRALLRPEDSDRLDRDEDENYAEYEDTAPCFKELEEILHDEQQIPTLAACRLGNADQRSYAIDLPKDPTVDVPLSDSQQRD